MTSMHSEEPKEEKSQQGAVTRAGGTRLSGEMIAILSVGATIAIALVALLISGFTWFGSINDKFDGLRKDYEERLETVRQRQEDSLTQSISGLRSTIEQRFQDRDARMQELADRQTRIEVQQQSTSD
jgi:hypothetical protein